MKLISLPFIFLISQITSYTQITLTTDQQYSLVSDRIDFQLDFQTPLQNGQQYAIEVQMLDTSSNLLTDSYMQQNKVGFYLAAKLNTPTYIRYDPKTNYLQRLDLITDNNPITNSTKNPATNLSTSQNFYDDYIAFNYRKTRLFVIFSDAKLGQKYIVSLIQQNLDNSSTFKTYKFRLKMYQQSYQQTNSCIFGCTNNGRCVNNVRNPYCECNTNYVGEDCSIKVRTISNKDQVLIEQLVSNNPFFVQFSYMDQRYNRFQIEATDNDIQIVSRPLYSHSGQQKSDINDLVLPCVGQNSQVQYVRKGSSRELQITRYDYLGSTRYDQFADTFVSAIVMFKVIAAGSAKVRIKCIAACTDRNQHYCGEESLRNGEIVGIVIGSLFGALFVGFLVYIVFKILMKVSRKCKNKKGGQTMDGGKDGQNVEVDQHYLKKQTDFDQQNDFGQQDNDQGINQNSIGLQQNDEQMQSGKSIRNMENQEKESQLIFDGQIRNQKQDDQELSADSNFDLQL